MKILKRGLVNGLGSIIKVRTGNMDTTEQNEIQKKLENVKTGQKTY